MIRCNRWKRWTWNTQYSLQQAVWEAVQYAPAPVLHTLQPSSSSYTPYACGTQACLAPWIFMIDRQRLAVGGSIEYGVVHIIYVVTWTANQSSLVTLTFDLESGVQVTCDVGYLCAYFSLPRPLCSRLRPDVCDRQTDVRQHHCLMPPPIRGRFNQQCSIILQVHLVYLPLVNLPNSLICQNYKEWIRPHYKLLDKPPICQLPFTRTLSVSSHLFTTH